MGRAILIWALCLTPLLGFRKLLEELFLKRYVASITTYAWQCRVNGKFVVCKGRVKQRRLLSRPEDRSMRVSTYEIIVPLPEEGNALLMHGLYGTIDIVALDLGEFLKEHRSKDVPPDHLNQSIENRLLKRHHLTIESQENEFERFKWLANKYEQKYSAEINSPKFVLILTYDCNFRCIYCFQHDLSGRINSKIQPMTIERAKNCLDIIENFPKHPSKLGVEIFGGEPLCKEYYSTVKYIVERLFASGRHTVATTNCYELDVFADLLGPNKIEDIIVTLDGPENIHDQRRRPIKGVTSFARIAENINLAISRQTKVRLRVNLDSTNLEYLSELANYVQKRGWFKSSYFQMYYAEVKAFPGQPRNANIIRTRDIVDYLIKNQEKCKPLKHIGEKASLLGTFLNSKELPTSQTRGCGAVGTSIFFSPDGLLYNCQEAAGRTEFAIGTYDSLLHLDDTSINKWRQRRMPNLPGCWQCPFVLLCAGGCAYRAIAISKDTEPSCEDFQDSFENIIKRERLLMRMEGD
jgi:uncharacterized protein